MQDPHLHRSKGNEEEVREDEERQKVSNLQGEHKSIKNEPFQTRPAHYEPEQIPEPIAPLLVATSIRIQSWTINGEFHRMTLLGGASSMLLVLSSGRH